MNEASVANPASLDGLARAAARRVGVSEGPAIVGAVNEASITNLAYLDALARRPARWVGVSGGPAIVGDVNEVSVTNPAYLDALARAAAVLQWPMPRVRDESLCGKFAHMIDALFVLVGRGRGAIDVALGDRLDALGAGNAVVELGFSGIGDYARERPGIAASTAQKMARLARELRRRPLLRDAVWKGEVSISKAEAVLSVAHGDAEQAWVQRARKDTVRGLKAAVKNSVGAQEEEDEEWGHFRTELGPEWRPYADEAMAFKDEPFSATMPKWERIEHGCEEVLGSFQAPDDASVDDLPVPTDILESSESIREWLESETKQWAFLAEVGTVPAPVPMHEGRVDARRLDEEIRHLSDARHRWGDILGHLAMIFRAIDGAQRLGFASFGHYCDERLGLKERTVRERASLERSLYKMPSLRRAIQKRLISYEKARLIARHARRGSIDRWIQRARRMTCIDLRRELQGKEERQMSARNSFAAWLPRRVQGLLSRAFRTIRKAVGRSIPPGECLGRIFKHLVETWRPLLGGRNTLQKRVLERDRWLCQVPCCSRAAAHAHHIVFRSAGGSDELKNLVSLCATHHLRGIHGGTVRVWGEAPDRLHWQLGVRPGLPPLLEYVSAQEGPAVLVDRGSTTTPNAWAFVGT